MLFSRDDVAEFINRNFEPVWESVRPVPIVQIDFGNGTKITRTLHGNIATYLCNAHGQVFDILPGIYTPSKYLEQLNQFRALAASVNRGPEQNRDARLKAYHLLQANKLRAAAATSVAAAKSPGERIDLSSPEELANWKLLAEDAQLNETERRKLIHEKLMATGAVKPDSVCKWLYKEVLHADLDDPYLGLGSLLFANYPFAKEDAH